MPSLPARGPEVRQLGLALPQPFGTFRGELDGVSISEGCGVMEEHDVRW